MSGGVAGLCALAAQAPPGSRPAGEHDGCRPSSRSAPMTCRPGPVASGAAGTRTWPASGRLGDGMPSCGHPSATGRPGASVRRRGRSPAGAPS